MTLQPGAPIYRIVQLGQTYAGRPVLEVEALDIYAGEILVLLGPSGAGKSTLLRLLNFLEAPTRGCIIFEGHEFRAGREMPLALRRKVTTVFQHPVLLNRSVWDNVRYGLRLQGLPDDREEIRATLEQVGLEHLARQRVRTLSGGEAQRVALARALLLRPDVLLLDEPTANLDPYNTGLIERIIGQLNRERATTLVLVTHNVFQARRLAQRVALMLEGQIVELADVERFFHASQDPRTAAFVRGEMVY
jgi:tungstate transport system ATP-binding protein